MEGIGAIFPIACRCQSRAFRSDGGLLFGVAASKGFDEDPLSGDITEHAEAAFARMSEVLEGAGLTRADVCFVNVYLHDVLKDVAAFNIVWRQYFEGLSPARCCVGVTLQTGILVEMVFVAQQPDS